jgi:hypothetical protein
VVAALLAARQIKVLAQQSAIELSLDAVDP